MFWILLFLFLSANQSIQESWYGQKERRDRENEGQVWIERRWINPVSFV